MSTSHAMNECDQYRYAAEFEARVAEKILVKRDSLCDKDEYGNCKRGYPMGDNCSACVLKFARLSVEAEMEKWE